MGLLGTVVSYIADNKYREGRSNSFMCVLFNHPFSVIKPVHNTVKYDGGKYSLLFYLR